MSSRRLGTGRPGLSKPLTDPSHVLDGRVVDDQIVVIPGKVVKGPGGAMDLVAGVPRIIVLMDHLDRTGSPKFRKRCSLPLTGVNVVDMIITNMAVFERPNRHSPFHLIEIADDISAEDVRAATGAEYVH